MVRERSRVQRQGPVRRDADARAFELQRHRCQRGRPGLCGLGLVRANLFRAQPLEVRQPRDHVEIWSGSLHSRR